MGMKQILVMMAAVVLMGCEKKENEPQKMADQAFEEAKIKANRGDAAAQCWVGSVYRHWENHNEAIKWYRKAADQGNANGQFILGLMYANGEGVPEKNIEKAIKWYRLAADQGLADAQYLVGVMYDNGEGVGEDNEEAFKWYRLAADQGYKAATENLQALLDENPELRENQPSQ